MAVVADVVGIEPENFPEPRLAIATVFHGSDGPGLHLTRAVTADLSSVAVNEIGTEAPAANLWGMLKLTILGGFMSEEGTLKPNARVVEIAISLDNELSITA